METIVRQCSPGARLFCLLTLTWVAATGLAFADCAPAIPYCDIGQIAPTVTITANQTGDLFGIYFGHIADFTDVVSVFDVTSNSQGPWVFDNQTTQRGARADFGFVVKGDILVVKIWDQDTGHIFASDPAYSDDATNHGYLYGKIYGDSQTPLAFVGMEDLEESEQTDWDYNDSEFFLVNVLTSEVQSEPLTQLATPEPASLVLVGTSLLAFWKKAKKA